MYRTKFDFPRRFDEKAAKALQKAFDLACDLSDKNFQVKKKADKALVRSLKPVISKMNKACPKHFKIDLSKTALEKFKEEWFSTLVSDYGKDEARSRIDDEAQMFEWIIDEAFLSLDGSDDEDGGESWTATAERDDAILSGKPSKKRKKPVRKAVAKRRKAA